QALEAAHDPARDRLETAAWRASWQRTATATERVIARVLDGPEAGLEPATEPGVSRALARLLPAGSLLFAGNSMPVRDLDSFFPVTTSAVTLLGNRGASGIDGVVSSALGAAAAAGRRLVLLIGDLSFYHDLNGLLALKRYGLDVTVVLLNNDGGGIF